MRLYVASSPNGAGQRLFILYASSPVTDRTDPYEIIGVRRDASLAEIRISYRRSTQILAPERFASASETVRAEAARRLSALNGAMEAIEAERAADSGSALGSLSFGGPAVAPAAEPSMRSTAVVDEPPPLAPPAEEPEAEPDVLADVPETIDEAPARQVEEPAPVEPEPPLAADEPESPLAADEPEPPVAVEEPDPEPPLADEAPAVEPEPEPPLAEEAPVTTADTEDDLPAVSVEDTSDDEPAFVAPEPEPVPLAFATPAPAARRPERERTTRTTDRQRSLLPRMLGAGALVAALAAIGVYFLLGNGSGGGKPEGGVFQRDGTPVSFDYPSDLVARQPPQGGLLKPTFSTAVGVDAGNYVVVATYRISANVQADGSAIGTGGTRLTADRFDQSVDRAAERIAAAQKLTAKGPVQPGKAGDLIARVYDYTRPNGSSARYVFAFRGHTEYSIACFWDPAHSTALEPACAQVMQTLRRTPA
jgi:hypothetical protein